MDPETGLLHCTPIHSTLWSSQQVAERQDGASPYSTPARNMHVGPLCMSENNQGSILHADLGIINDSEETDSQM